MHAIKKLVLVYACMFAFHFVFEKEKLIAHCAHEERKKEKVFAKLFGHNFLHGALAFC